MKLIVILSALLIAAFSLAARGEEHPLRVEQLAAGSYAARAVEGARLAAERCDSCHMIEQPGSGARPFAVIAAERSPEQIHAFLLQPHGNAPSSVLSDPQIQDTIAYMKSLNPD